jgi:predicted nucleotidyltransferase
MLHKRKTIHHGPRRSKIAVAKRTTLIDSSLDFSQEGRYNVQPIIETRRAELAELCRRFQVRRLEVFGSATRDNFDPARSDVDFLVEFEPESPLRGLDQYFGLKEGLETLFDRQVDLVEAGVVKNPYLLAGIERSRETLYAA